jgi:hypothetical protein
MAIAPVGKFVVGKAFEHDGAVLQPGTIVDVTGWRNAAKLITMRYLYPVPVAQTSAKVVEQEAPVVAEPVVEEEKETVAPVKKSAAKKVAAKKVDSEQVD